MGRLVAFLVRLMLIATCGLLLAVAGVFTCYYPIMVALVVGRIAWLRYRNGWSGGWAYGTARLSTMLDLAGSGLLSDKGLILGRCNFLERPTRMQAVRGLFSLWVRSDIALKQFAAAWRLTRAGSDTMIRVSNYVHLATFSPTAGGKGVSCVIPNVLSHDGSMVILDIKGEIFKLTAEHRSTKFNHRIIRLDPYGVCGPGGDSLNPLDFIDIHATSFADQARDVADMLIYRKGTEPDPHWSESAVMVASACIAYVRGCEKEASFRTLATVYEILSSRYSYGNALAAMRQVQEFGGVIARMGNLLSWFVEKELGSVLTTVNRNLAFLNSPAVAACTSQSSFHPRDLRDGKTTVYLIIPPEHLSSTAAPLMRLWLGTLFREIARLGPTERRPILFMLDEVAHLGHLQALEDAITLMRGYGVRLWLFLQSIEQLNACYGPKAPIILGNIGTQQYFGINAYESADAISKRVGDCTILVDSLNRSTSTSQPYGGQSGVGQQPGNYSTSRAYNSSELGRRVFRPEEILTLRSDVALTFHKNLPVIPAKLLTYYAAPEFKNGGIGTPKRMGLVAALCLLLALVFGGRLTMSHLMPAARSLMATAARLQLLPSGKPPSAANAPHYIYITLDQWEGRAPLPPKQFESQVYFILESRPTNRRYRR